MLKAILLFIKTHAVATAITTTVVIGVGVATPIVVDNYNLNKNVQASIGMLAQNDNPQENTDEPLTFRIEKVESYSEGGSMVENMKGEDAIELPMKSVSYNIVPSYNKDVSDWTKEEKEEYERAVQEVADMAKAHYDAAVEKEEKTIAEISAELEKEQISWSEYYVCGVGSIRYNSYTKKYNGSYSIMTKTITDGGYGATYDYEDINVDTSVEDFRNNIYPILLQEFKRRVDENSWLKSEINEYETNLNMVYHLSD